MSISVIITKESDLSLFAFLAERWALPSIAKLNLNLPFLLIK